MSVLFLCSLRNSFVQHCSSCNKPASQAMKFVLKLKSLRTINLWSVVLQVSGASWFSVTTRVLQLDVIRDSAGAWQLVPLAPRAPALQTCRPLALLLGDPPKPKQLAFQRRRNCISERRHVVVYKTFTCSQCCRLLLLVNNR